MKKNDKRGREVNGKGNRIRILIAVLMAEVLSLAVIFWQKHSYEYLRTYEKDQLVTVEGGSGIRSPEEKFFPGIYEISVVVVTNAVNGGETLVGFEVQGGIANEEISVYSPGRTVNFRGYVTAGSDHAFVSVSGKEEIDFQVNQVRITYLPTVSARTAFLEGFMLFAAADALLFLGHYCLSGRKVPGQKKTRREKCLTLLFIFAAGIVVSIPLARGGIFFSHDFMFHLNRIYGLEKGLSTQFPVRIQPFWMNDYGYPVGVCYGDLLLYVPALLHLAGFPLRIVYKVYIFCINVLTAGISTFCFGRIAGSRKVGKICGFLYTASLWRLADLYNRSALGEYSAITFLPFLALGFWYLFRDQPDHKRGFFCLTAGYTGIIHTHVVSCVLAAIFTVLICVLEFRKIFCLSKKILRTLAGTAGAVLLFNAGFLVPFLDYYLTVPLSLSEIQKENIQTYGARLKELIPWKMYPAAWGGPSTEEIRFTTTIGLSLLLVPLAAGIWMVILFFKGKQNRKQAYGLLKIIIPAILSLWMSTHYFPYDAIQEKFPAVFRVIGSVQYPWRYLTAALVLCTLLAALTLSAVKEKKLIFGGMCLVLIAVSAGQAFAYQQKHMQDGVLYRIMDVAQLNRYYDLEYRLYGTDIYDTSPEILRSNGIELFGIQREGMNFRIDVDNQGTEEGFLELPVLAYKGFAAETADGKISLETGTNNRIRLSVPPGFQGRIYTHFVEPWYWRLAEGISVLTLVFFIVTVSRDKKHLDSGAERSLPHII